MMNRYFVAYFLSAVILFVFTSGDLCRAADPKTDTEEIRIVSYNIRNARGMDGVVITTA